VPYNAAIRLIGKSEPKAQGLRPFAALSSAQKVFLFARNSSIKELRMDVVLFPFSQYWWAYLAFTGFVLLLLALDLGVFHRKPHEVSFREAAAWSAAWVALSLTFNFLLYHYALWKFGQDPRLISQRDFDPHAAAWQTALEFLTGYVIEYSLSVDNIFVFVVVLNYFAVPPRYQHRVLFYGILGALVFRAVFIAMGAVLMQYHSVILIFGGFLIFTGLKMMFGPESSVDPESNLIIRTFRRFMPVTSEMHGPRFFVRLNNAWWATPLFIALLFLELTDIIFAIDSVPAIFALTKEPLIVFTSNIFAILGLRSMYFMLAGAIDRFHLLKYGLAIVLIFVGLKMVWLDDMFGGKFPISYSLGFISIVLIIAILVSLLFTKKTGESPAIKQ
jgi:tellurite resistance protein TerC